MGQKSISRIIKAFYEGKTAKDKHDRCENYNLYYRDNLIAYIKQGDLWISSAGWRTNTTKSRLNQLGNFHLTQKNFQWFINGFEWDGNPINVKDFILNHRNKSEIKQQKQTLFSWNKK